MKLAQPGDWEGYRKAKLLPRDLLHPTIARAVLFDFARGEYDAAVFKAFKAVEVAVRAASGLSASLIGTKLMRAAFDVESGILTDSSADRAEREALAHLFAGAIGSYKNPQSHRDVGLGDPADAVEMIILASHLLRITDTRRARSFLGDL